MVVYLVGQSLTALTLYNAVEISLYGLYGDSQRVLVCGGQSPKLQVPVYNTTEIHRNTVHVSTSGKTQKIKYITEILLSKLGTIHISENTVYRYTYMNGKCIKQKLHALQYFANA